MEIKTFSLGDYHPPKDGTANAFSALHACFTDAARCERSVITVEPGDYLVDSATPIPLASGMTVKAEGAVFRFPAELGDAVSRKMFYGENLRDVTWLGGHFEGHVFDPDREENPWPPHTYTGCIHLHSVGDGHAENVRFSGLTARDIAGAVIHVRGRKDDFARQVSVENCRFDNCGKFMWDYGYLWQHVVFASEYTPEAVKNALRWLPEEQMSSALTLKDGALWADFMPAMLPEERDQITFFDPAMPEGIRRGKQYAVLNRGAENGLVIAEDFGKPAITLTSLPEGLRLFRNMFYIFHDLYAPIGDTAPQKGSIDTTYCRDVTVSGCRFSASGDSMHLLACENAVFANNQILGARMGAFYIGFLCRNVTVVGNTVYGTNGSRVVSVERSSENITITGNLFCGGGRGSWFNQPKNLIISDNLFLRNTGKSTPDIHTGRISQATGDYEKCPELYFTTWQENGTYGPVILRGNIIETDAFASAAVAFNPGGHDLVLDGNCIRGEVRTLQVAKGCEPPVLTGDQGFSETVEGLYVNTANVR